MSWKSRPPIPLGLESVPCCVRPDLVSLHFQHTNLNGHRVRRRAWKLIRLVFGDPRKGCCCRKDIRKAKRFSMHSEPTTPDFLSLQFVLALPEPAANVVGVGYLLLEVTSPSLEPSLQVYACLPNSTSSYTQEEYASRETQQHINNSFSLVFPDRNPLQDVRYNRVRYHGSHVPEPKPNGRTIPFFLPHVETRTWRRRWRSRRTHPRIGTSPYPA